MDTPQERAQNFLIFHLSGLDCAFPLVSVREIVPMAMLSSPPGMPAGLAGFLDLRGTAIPILRLDRLFDLAEQRPGLHTPMIVLRGTGSPIGILVDSVRGIVPVFSARLLNLPEGGTFRSCARASFELDGDLIHLLSADTLLDVSEVQSLAEYSALSQTRVLQFERTAECAAQVRQG